MFEFERIVRKRVRDYWIIKGLSGIFAVIWMLLIFWWCFTSLFRQNEVILLFEERCTSNLGSFLNGFLSTGILWAGWVVLYMGIYFFSNSASVKTQGILLKECNPYLYEACLQRTERFLVYPSVYRLYLAKAAYYQGDFQKAWNVIQTIHPGFFMAKWMYEYYQIKALICFEMNLEEIVFQVEEEFRRRAGRKGLQMFRACCNLRRAYNNQDFNMAYFFLQEWTENMKKKEDLCQKVFLTYWNGLIDVGAGNWTEGKEKLSWVAVKGNRLYFARQAKEILSREKYLQSSR